MRLVVAGVLVSALACSGPPARPVIPALRPPAWLHLTYQDLSVDLTTPRLLQGRAHLTVRNSGGRFARGIPLYLTPFARLGEVRVGGRVRSTRLEPSPRRHEVVFPLAPGREARVEVDWSIDLSSHDTRVRLGQAIALEPGARVVELMEWHPRLRPMGDAEKPPFRLEVRAPADEVVLAPGHLAGVTREGAVARTIYEDDVGPAFLEIVSGRYEIARLTAHGLNVEVFLAPTARVPRERLGAMADLLGRGLAFYAEAFGPAWTRPPALRLSTAPIRGARALPFAIVLGEDGEYLTGDLGGRTAAGNRRDSVLLHELAHLWWGHLLTAPPSEAALLHEGLAQFSMLLALEAVVSSSAATEVRRELRARALGRGPALLGLSLAVPGAAARAQAKGAMIFETLRARGGHAALLGALREAVRLYRGGTLTFAALSGLIAQARDEEAARRLFDLASSQEAPRVRVSVGRLENMPDGTFARVLVENRSRLWAYAPIAVEYGGRTTPAAADVPPKAEVSVRVPVGGSMTETPRLTVDPEARALVAVEAPER
jgi:hypothetical protein